MAQDSNKHGLQLNVNRRETITFYLSLRQQKHEDDPLSPRVTHLFQEFCASGEAGRAFTCKLY